MKFLLTLPVLTGLFLLSSVAAHATTVANFTGGNDTNNGGTATPATDTYTGTAGAGWQTPWTLTSNTSGATTNTVTNANPLNGGGNYLSSTSTGNGVLAGTSRQYGGSGDNVSLTSAQRITFTFRVDESAASLNSTFNTSGDRYQFFGDKSALSNGGSTNEWFVFASGAIPAAGTGGTYTAKDWEFYSGNTGNTGFTAGTLYDSGIALVSGTTYTFTIVTDPTTKTYVGTLTNGLTTYTTPTLNWRDYNTSSNASGGYLNFDSSGADASGGNDTRSFSLDSVSITAVPEPRTGMMPVFLLTGVAGSGVFRLLCRRPAKC